MSATVIRYSESFKLQVVRELESGPGQDKLPPLVSRGEAGDRANG